MKHYIALMRLNKPIGILLLLWPTLWALFLASEGHPPLFTTFIFVAGVVVMRSAGCIINDFADRHIDLHVSRTCDRPLTSGKVTVKQALTLFVILAACAFSLVLFLNPYTIELAVIGMLLTLVYPFMKRVTHLPQVGLGVAFAWGVPMAFSAILNTVPFKGWVVFAAAFVWPIIYDTMYALCDREEDLTIGVKSTAILFQNHTLIILGALQIVFLSLLVLIGSLFKLSPIFYFSILISAALFIYQLWLIKDNLRERCFKAFLNNQWIGFILFLGIVFHQYF